MTDATHGLGCRIRDASTDRGDTLDAWFRWLGWGEFGESAPADVDVAPRRRRSARRRRRVVVRPIRLTIDVDAAPTSAADVYLRLHLLSHRLAAPNSLNLDGVFGLLNTVAWTDLGPVAVADLADVVLARRAAGGDAHRRGARQVPADARLRRAEPACASPTPAASGSAPTSPRAPR